MAQDDLKTKIISAPLSFIEIISQKFTKLLLWRLGQVYKENLCSLSKLHSSELYFFCHLHGYPQDFLLPLQRKAAEAKTATNN